MPAQSATTSVSAQKPQVEGPKYRRAFPIPDEVRKHCDVYFDEKLYLNALTLLADIVSSGASQPTLHLKHALVPVPKHLELISTLLVHPKYTTRAAQKEREIPSLALTILRDLLAIVGPINSSFEKAFCFHLSAPTKNSWRSRHAVDHSEPSSPILEGEISQKGVWHLARDFWHVVGWAFNCSTCYPRRWRYWKVYLAFMLDVLDADWEERDRLDETSSVKRKLEEPHEVSDDGMLPNSLLAQYLLEADGRSSAIKRIVKAAFAEGSRECLKSYPEVFHNETKKGSLKRKREGLDDLPFAGYHSNLASGSSPGGESPTPSTTSTPEPTNAPLGGSESIVLRQRVMTILSRAAFRLPKHFTSIVNLYDIFWECVNPLPIAQFSQFVSPSNSNPLPTGALISLTQLICVRLISHEAPTPDDDDISQDILVSCYLPFAANTSSAEANAKLAILVENLLRLAVKLGRVKYTPSLEQAIEEGIQARDPHSRATQRRKNPSGKVDDTTATWLKGTGIRLKSITSWLKDGSRK